MFRLSFKVWRSLSVAWPLLVILLTLVLVGFRAWLVDHQVGAYVGCPDCFVWPVIGADAWLVAGFAIALLVSVNLKPIWLSRVAGLVTAFCILLYVLDLFIMRTFGIRLFFIDLAVYGLEPAIIWEQYAGLLGGPVTAGAVGAVVAVICAAPVWLPRRPNGAVNLVLIIVALTGLLIGTAVQPVEYGNNWVYRNVFQANLNSAASERYSATVAASYLQSYRENFPDRCVQGPQHRPNVIIVIIESWSAYQSPAFGGFVQWTPELDRIARQHSRFTRFYAGGFSTNEGLANLLGGVRLWVPFTHFYQSAAFGSLWGLKESLPELFNRNGYHTALLTTGPLSFTSKDAWFRDIGFDHVEGNKRPFYDDWPKFSFHAAGDEALYRRALDWVDDKETPWMLALETVSTHAPYIDPGTGKRDKEAVFRYADHWAAWFFERLQESGYFNEGGILIFTSDHRTMDPMRPEERERFGQAAASRIPLIWIEQGDSLPPIVDEVYKLSDLLPTFKHRIEGLACMDAFEASFFENPPYDGNCAFHLRGSARGTVDVFCKRGWGRVQLQGDDTRFIESKGLSEKRRERILHTIARDRLQGLKRHPENSIDGPNSE